MIHGVKLKGYVETKVVHVDDIIELSINSGTRNRPIAESYSGSNTMCAFFNS